MITSQELERISREFQANKKLIDALIKAYLEARMPQVEIAERFGLPKHVVQDKARKFGIGYKTNRGEE